MDSQPGGGIEAGAVPMSGRIEAGAHRFWLRVYYEDTDAVGIVYYANYLRFAERARTEMLRLAGVNQAELRERLGLVFVVKDCAIDYRWPARLDDVLEVRSRVSEIARAWLTLEQRVLDTADGRNRAVLTVRVVCVDANGRPARIPGEVTDALAPYRESLE